MLERKNIGLLLLRILVYIFYIFRWSHAERLLAIDQLIDTCEPQQVRHMMQVSFLASHLHMSVPVVLSAMYRNEIRTTHQLVLYAMLKNLNKDFLVGTGTRFITSVECPFVCYGR